MTSSMRVFASSVIRQSVTLHCSNKIAEQIVSNPVSQGRSQSRTTNVALGSVVDVSPARRYLVFLFYLWPCNTWRRQPNHDGADDGHLHARARKRQKVQRHKSMTTCWFFAQQVAYFGVHCTGYACWLLMLAGL